MKTCIIDLVDGTQVYYYYYLLDTFVNSVCGGIKINFRIKLHFSGLYISIDKIYSENYLYSIDSLL